ncbi:probable E3 ubiquitin-protein ligase RNF144A [Mangifera indica]|uniref:probable E3 ubiquitin-protein ligase RNF144A n=1 Tax=Mangifera indica TaxID=29780 RepID=UPI001CFA2F8B|nr:probable E3 ubiquitin-protein ligase RNF144A [Mangifera indica]
MKHSLQKLSENIQNEEEDDGNASSTCKICIEPISTHNKFHNSNHCAHAFCVDCIAKYIELRVEDHEAMIGCPELNCKQVLDPLWCRTIISESVFAKWCDVLCDNYVLGFERSYCPNRNCRELVVNECGGEVKKSKCPNCKELFCFGCKLRWHAGYGCEQSRNLRDPNDSLFGQLVERNAWVVCPACGYCLERANGCNVVKCSYCNTLVQKNSGYE